jgi:hypothetical protein
MYLVCFWTLSSIGPGFVRLWCVGPTQAMCVIPCAGAQPFHWHLVLDPLQLQWGIGLCDKDSGAWTDWHIYCVTLFSKILLAFPVESLCICVAWNTHLGKQVCYSTSSSFSSFVCVCVCVCVWETQYSGDCFSMWTWVWVQMSSVIKKLFVWLLEVC